MSTMALTILCLLVLYFLAGLFCAIETAFTSCSRAWLRELAEQGNKRAILARRLLENAGEFFGTVLMGTNLVHVSITTLVRSVLAVAIVHTATFMRLAQWLGLKTDMDSLLTSAIVTPTLLFFTELLPKAIGRNNADSMTLSLAAPLNFFRVILKAPVYIIDFFSARLARALGTSKEGQPMGKVSRDDLKILANVAAEQGLIRKEAGNIMAKVLDLDNKPVETIMVPLVDVKSLPLSASVDDVENLAASSGFTRFPVYDGRVDEIVGIISLRRCMFEMALHAELPGSVSTGHPIATMVDRNIMFVPESMTVGAVLTEFRRSHTPMMMVVDEYGGVVGMVTIEDLLGLLVGGIQDLRNQAANTVRRTSSSSFECDGKADIHDLEPFLGFKVDNQGYETAAGLALKLFGTIPKAKATIPFRNFTIHVLEVQKHRITKLAFTTTKNPQKCQPHPNK